MLPEQFVSRVWEVQGHGWYCLSTKDSRRWRDHFFKAPVSPSTIRKFLSANAERNLYFCPTPLKEERRKKDCVVGSRFLWADLDESDPRKSRLKPQLAWESSPGRYAALWRLDEFGEPAEIEQANKKLTYALGADKGGWDLSQVLRIPGTRNHKYKNSPLGRLLWFSNSEISLDDIPSSHKVRPSTLKLLNSPPTLGKRSEVIWRIENELREQGLPDDEILRLVKASPWNKFRGRHDEDHQLRREIDKLPAKANGHANGHAIIESSIVRMSDVMPETVKWVWYPYIPRGKVTLLEGDPGLGKSWLTTSLAAHISRRMRLPNAKRFVGGSVLILSAEDGLGDTIRPRLDGLKADVSKVYAHDGALTFDDDGCAWIKEQIDILAPALVVVDPLVAYLGGTVDLHKANETREVMTRLSRIALDCNTAILAVRHLTKGGRDKSIYRGIGSIDLTASARSVLLVGRDPNDDHARAMVHIKSNLATTGPSIRYELRPGFKAPFRWGGITQLTADEVLRADRKSGVSEYDLARSYLESLGEDYNREAVMREAEGRGISPSVIKQVAREKGIRL